MLALVVVVVWDAGRRVSSANPSAQRILGMPAGELEEVNGSRGWAMLRPDGTPITEEERPRYRTRMSGEPCIGVELGRSTSAWWSRRPSACWRRRSPTRAPPSGSTPSRRSPAIPASSGSSSRTSSPTR